MFRIGDRVYPANSEELQDCEATEQEMDNLVGIVVEVNKTQHERTYSVTWIDTRDGEEAEFSHGLKEAYWDEEELTGFYHDYGVELEKFFRGEDFDDDDIDIIAYHAIDHLVNDYLHTELADYGIKTHNPHYNDIVDKILETIADKLN